jgi:2,3,4,5-tetrahydropyridine-2-carboxylate N-succinyltransferase
VPTTDLSSTISSLFAQGPGAPRGVARDAFFLLRAELSAGRVRAVEPDPSSPAGWRTNAWVVQGILLGIRFGDNVDMGIGKGRWPFVDKDTLPLRAFDPAAGIRVAPGGSSVREGAYLGRGVTCLPPAYIDIGAYVGDDTLIESHALVGSCAQVGSGVRVGAGTQIGGIGEDLGAAPVVVEDRVVLAPGTIVTGASVVYDLPNERIIRAGAGQPLVIPRRGVVVPGSRAVADGAGKAWGLSLAVPVIVEYEP